MNATAGGFKSTIIAALTFYVGATLVRDIYLEVGDTSETVVVREKGRYMVLVSARGCEPCLAALTVILVCVLVGAPGYAQSSAVLEGRVLDTSGAVIPGATIRVRSPSTAFDRTVSTDAEGRYHIVAIPAGTYVVTASATGFRTEILDELTINVGLTLVREFRLELGDQSETVVVRAPLVDVTSPGIGGNVDRQQMEQLPLSGRNWMELALQVEGVTGNDGDNRPGVSADSAFQLNLDGQQVTNEVAASNFFGQPRFSREAIAEFQVISNLFDITEGRSTGMQVRAISRSGANRLKKNRLIGFDFHSPRSRFTRELKHERRPGLAGTPVGSLRGLAGLGDPLLRSPSGSIRSDEDARRDGHSRASSLPSADWCDFQRERPHSPAPLSASCPTCTI